MGRESIITVNGTEYQPTLFVGEAQPLGPLCQGHAGTMDQQMGRVHINRWEGGVLYSNWTRDTSDGAMLVRPVMQQ